MSALRRWADRLLPPARCLLSGLRSAHRRATRLRRPDYRLVLPDARHVLAGAIVALHAALLLAALAVPVHAVLAALFGAGPVTPTATDVGYGTSTAPLARWLGLLGNTGAVCGVALSTALAIGLVGGLLVGRTDLPGRSILIGIALLFACIPAYVTMTFALAYLPVTRLGQSLLACGLLYGLIHAPLAVLVLSATFRCADRELEDLARLDAGPAAVLRRATLPQARWGMAMLGLLVILLVATDFTVTDILSVRTFAEEVYTQFELRRSAAGPVLTSIPLLLLLAAMLVSIQVRYRLLGEHTPWQFGLPPRTLRLGRWRTPLALAAAVFVIALLTPPVAALLAHIGSPEAFLASASGLQRELWVSAALSALAAGLVVLASPGLAVSLLRGRRLRVPVAAAIVLLLATPGPVVGISLIHLLNRPGLPGAIYDSPAATLIGYVVRFLPIGVLLLAAAVQRVPRELESAARIDGCDWLGVQRHVYWPAVLPDAGVAWLVVVILAFADVATTKLLAAPGWETASVRAFTLLHFGVYRDLAVLAVLSTGFILIPWAGLVVLLKGRAAMKRNWAVRSRKSEKPPTRSKPPGSPRLALGFLLLISSAAALAPAAGCERGALRDTSGAPQQTVVVYTALDRQFSEPILAEFTRRTGIKVLPVYDAESTKTVGLVNRIRAEAQRPRCDVFWNNEILNTLRLKAEGLLQPCQPASAADYPGQYRDPEGYWYGFAARARVILVNTQLVPAEQTPASLRDLAHPRWRGQVGIAKPLFGTTASHVACLFALLGADEAKALLDGLKHNDIRVVAGNRTCAEMVGNGQLALGLTDTDDAIAEQEAGRPVKIIFPDSEPGGTGTLVLPNTLAVVRGAPHPDAAEKLIAYLLSPEVEARLAQGPSAQIPLNPRTTAVSRVARLEDLKPMPIDFARAAEAFPTAARYIESTFLE